jgi:hypothetical protein
MCSKEGYRSSIDLEDESTTREEAFAHSYFNTCIKVESLPLLENPTASYVPQGPNFLVAWVNSFLFQQRKEQSPFLADFVEEITFLDYAVEFKKEQAELEVRLNFEVNREDQVQLVLLGAMHRSAKGGAGVEWIKSEGNSFWLSAIRTRLTESFSSLL